MHKQIQKNQAGAVSMITVIFITVLLSIITVSFIRITINEQRQATDDDLTTRAYYAAESGVQDAITALKANKSTGATINNPDTCQPHLGTGELSSSDNLDTSYTCQTIDTAPGDYQAELEDGEAVFFKLDSGGVANISNIEVSWHILGDKSTGGDGQPVALRPSSPPLPSKDAWSFGGLPFPAMLRVQLVDIPSSGNVQRGNIVNNIGFLDPGSGTIPYLIGTPSGLDGHIVTGCNNGLPIGSYICSTRINNIDDGARDYYLRIQPVYAPTHIKVVARDAANNIVNIVNAQAVIDVTGRAGDVYRRVEERVSLVSDSIWPNYAILSAEDLCKNFIITDEASHATKPDFAQVNPSVIGSCSY